MKHDISDLIRVALLFILIYALVIGCMVETAPADVQLVSPGSNGTTPDPESDPEKAGTNPATPDITPTTNPVTIPTEPAPEAPTEPQVTWLSLGTYELTAYCPCQKCCGQWAVNRPVDKNGNTIVYTASGAVAKAGTTIAVDPSIIPYGSEIQINGHTYIAQDCGGAIKGNRIDVYFNTHQEALEFGRQRAEVFIKTTSP